jgi:hypothetical protein
MSDYDSDATYDGDAYYDSEPTTPKKMATAVLDIRGLTLDQIVEKATTLHTKLTGNANFTTPNPSLAALLAMISAVTTARDNHAAAVETAKNLLLVRDNALAALVTGLRQEIAYIQTASGGDAVKITSAGAGVKSAKTPVTELGTVEHLALTVREGTGKFDAMWDPVKGAKFYEVQTSSDPNDESKWKDFDRVTGSRCVIDGQTSGARVWVRVRARGAKKLAGAWSDPAVRTVP